MRRYRFGRIAALVAAVYVAAVVVSGVLALATGDPALLREIVTGGWDPDFMPYTWWVELLMVAGGVLQGWAYWQVLRGRPAGAAAVNDRPVRLLRVALYLSVACTLLYRLPIPYQWWFGLPSDLLQVAVVGLFFVVLAGRLPRWLRVLGLVAGLANAAMGMAATFAYGLGQWSACTFVSPYQLGNAVYLLWLVPVLAGQARDARWTRGTVRMGMASAALSLLSSGGAFDRLVRRLGRRLRPGDAHGPGHPGRLRDGVAGPLRPRPGRPAARTVSGASGPGRAGAAVAPRRRGRGAPADPRGRQPRRTACPCGSAPGARSTTSSTGT